MALACSHKKHPVERSSTQKYIVQVNHDVDVLDCTYTYARRMHIPILIKTLSSISYSQLSRKRFSNPRRLDPRD